MEYSDREKELIDNSFHYHNKKSGILSFIKEHKKKFLLITVSELIMISMVINTILLSFIIFKVD